MKLDLTKAQAQWLYNVLRCYECAGYDTDYMGKNIPTRESAREEKLRANVMKKLRSK